MDLLQLLNTKELLKIIYEKDKDAFCDFTKELGLVNEDDYLDENGNAGLFTHEAIAEHIKEGSLDLIELLGVQGCYALLNNLFIDLQEINQTTFDNFIYEHNLIFNDDLVNNNLLDDLNDEMKEKLLNNLFCSTTPQQQEKMFKEYKRQNGLYEFLSASDCYDIAKDYIDDNGIDEFINKYDIIEYLENNL